MIEFEGVERPAPKGYHELLCCYYGEDYLTPKETPTYHGGLIIDPHRSYQEVLKEL